VNHQLDDLGDRYGVPLHRSLTSPILVMGVPREIAIINGTCMAALGLGLHSWEALPVGLLIHLIAVTATRRDPEFFVVFRRALRQKAFYRA
jgi:type IV secretory pathway TrbD component